MPAGKKGKLNYLGSSAGSATTPPAPTPTPNPFTHDDTLHASAHENLDAEGTVVSLSYCLSIDDGD